MSDSRPLITLTTDFGYADTYVAEMKGVILSIAPDVQLVDVTHAIPPQEVRSAALAVAQAIRAFPPKTVHIVVVDPGVGSDRALLAVEAAGQRFLSPDNGALTEVIDNDSSARLHRLTEPSFWRHPVSPTFHGRDILAPVAAHWILGRDLADFGPEVSASTVVRLDMPRSVRGESGAQGQVVRVDSFGNLVTNIARADLPAVEPQRLVVSIFAESAVGLCQYYAERPVGSLVALLGSHGRVEIGVNQGSAAMRLNASPGAPVSVTVGR
jgi:hypothetical protein